MRPWDGAPRIDDTGETLQAVVLCLIKRSKEIHRNPGMAAQGLIPDDDCVHDGKDTSLPVIGLLDRPVVRPEPRDSWVTRQKTGGLAGGDDAVEVTRQQQFIE